MRACIGSSAEIRLRAEGGAKAELRRSLVNDLRVAAQMIATN
jgi:hypothetical protein